MKVRALSGLALAVLGLLPSLAGAVKVEVGNTLTGSTSSAEPPLTVTMRLLAETPRVGDPVELLVTVSKDPGIEELHSGEYGETLGKWDITIIRKGTATKQGNREVRTDRVTLATYQAGRRTIPGIAVRYQEPGGRRGEYRAPPLTVDITSLPAKKGDQPGHIRGLKPPQGMLSWWWMGAGLLLAAGLGTGVWWVARRSGLPLVGGTPQAPPRPPHETARERLASLRAQGWPAQGEFKRYYIELSDILRRYLEERLSWPVTEWTTLELSRRLKASSLDRRDQASVREVLERSDLVKFAKDRPDVGEADTDTDLVAALIERTTPPTVETTA